MAASITSNPGVLVYPAGQRLIYSLSTSSTITDTYRYVVQVMEFNTTEIGKFYLTPNPEGKAFFDLSQVIQGRLKRDIVDNGGDPLWDDSTVFAKSPENSKGYQIRVGEFIGGSETLDQANANIYLIDGYEQQRLGLHPGFSDYYPTASTKKVWLTEKPVAASDQIEYKMATEDSGSFAFLYNQITGGFPAYIQQRVYNASGIVSPAYTTSINPGTGSNSPSFDPFLAGGSLVYANVGPFNLFQRIAEISDWTYMEIDVRNGGGVLISKVLKITRDCPNPKTTPTQMAFSNSVGGYDYIRWDGRRVQTLTKQDKTYRPLQGTWGASTFTIDPTGADVEVYQNQVREQYSLNALLNSSDYDLLSSAFKSRQVFVKIGTYWLPCRLNEKSLRVESEPISKLFAVVVTAVISQDVRC